MCLCSFVSSSWKNFLLRTHFCPIVIYLGSCHFIFHGQRSKFRSKVIQTHVSCTNAFWEKSRFGPFPEFWVAPTQFHLHVLELSPTVPAPIGCRDSPRNPQSTLQSLN